jgi:hypothetical protein
MGILHITEDSLGIIQPAHSSSTRLLFAFLVQKLNKFGVHLRFKLVKRYCPINSLSQILSSLLYLRILFFHFLFYVFHVSFNIIDILYSFLSCGIRNVCKDLENLTVLLLQIFRQVQKAFVFTFEVLEVVSCLDIFKQLTKRVYVLVNVFLKSFSDSH